jgi:anti-sigma regulatory factor (Ser/Thr protein kinase)
VAGIWLRAQTKVDPPSSEALLRGLSDAGALGPRDRVTLDLSGMQLVDPYGLALLWITIRHIVDSGATPLVIAPTREGTANYLGASRLLDALPCKVDCQPALPDTGFRRTSAANVLAVTEMQSDSGIQAVRDRCRAILTRQLGCSEAYADSFGSTLSELCQNVLDHARDPHGGVVAAQRYRRSDGVEFVVLAVADAGIGIRQSLNSRYEGRFTGDADAIQAAFDAAYTGQPGDRGLGLPKVLRVCRKYRGRIDVRSGGAWVRRTATTTQWSCGTGAPLPGTLVGVSLYAVE